MSENMYQKLADDSREWMSKEMELAKLNFASRLGHVVALIILGFVLVVANMMILAFLGVCLANWLDNYMEPEIAYLILTGLYVLLVVLMIAFRRPLLIRPLKTITSEAILDQHIEGDVTDLQLKLRHESEDLRKQMDRDVADIHEEITRPSTWADMLKYLPVAINVGTTLWPVVKKLMNRSK